MYVCSIGPVDSHMLYAIRIHVRLHRSNSIITYINSTNPNDSTHLLGKEGLNPAWRRRTHSGLPDTGGVGEGGGQGRVGHYQSFNPA